MTHSAHDIFTAIKDKELLAIIAGKRGVDPDEHKKNLGKAIADEVHGHGLKKLLDLVPEKDLEGFGVETKNEDKTKVKREALCKRIFAAMLEAGPAKYLEKLESSFLNNLFTVLDVEKPSGATNKKLAEALLQYADSIGVENTLSSLNVTQLQTIASSLKLSVDSNSVSVSMDCIINGESYKKEKKKPAQPSAKKPYIKKGVSKVDLQQHYYRGELAEYCKNNSLTASGSKKELINRIVDHLEGKETKKKEGAKKRKAPAGGKQNAKKKQKTEKGSKASDSKSEKSDKE